MKRVLIPVDFSENSKLAVLYALELLKYEQAKFYLMHAYADEVYEEDTSKNQFQQRVDQIDQSVQKQLTSLARAVGKNAIIGNHEFRLISSFNSLIDETEKIVKKKDIDLVIMGTKGVQNSKLSFGSKTIQVLRFIESPVLSVPKLETIHEPKTMLFLTDFMKSYEQRELELICELAHQFQSKIDVLFVSPKKQLSDKQLKNKKLINEVLHKNQINFKTVPSTELISSIMDYIDENTVDMVILANTKHTSLDKVILPSVIDQVSAKVKLPLLVLQNIRDLKRSSHEKNSVTNRLF